MMDDNKLSIYNSGISLGYNPYLVLYAIDKGINVETKLQCSYDFIPWIMARHRAFEPDESKRNRDNYSAEFIEWLKNKILNKDEI